MSISLLQWRRTVRDLYGAARQEPDPRTAWRVWRAGRDELFATHPDSPVRPERFAPLRFFPYDPAFRFVVPVEPARPERFEVATTTDGVVPFSRIGRVRLTNAVHDLGTLDVWWLESYGGGVFVPFKDATAPRETYGGGRYLIDTVKGADLGSGAGSRASGSRASGSSGSGSSGSGSGRSDSGRSDSGDILVLDLNFAYNPSCAYDPAWACPLPPTGNQLSGRVTAGELTWQPASDAPGPDRRISN